MANNEKENLNPIPPQTIEEEANLPSNFVAVDSTPMIPGRQSGGPVGAPPQASTGIDNFQSGQLPPFLGLSSDLVAAGTPGPRVPTTRLMPIAASGVSQNVSSIHSTVVQIVDAAIAKLPTPAPTPPPVTDGLTHGTTPWESDPSYLILRDDFHAALGTNDIAGTIPTVGIGQLGWALLGTTGNEGGVIGGVPPNVGQYGWSNDATASDAGWLTFGGSGTFSNSDYSQLGWALLDNTGWVASFVFKVDVPNPLSSAPNFSMAQTALYVGFCGQAINPWLSVPQSRPDVFIGVRYDTSTTSPAINDSFFTLEVVANPTFSTPIRNNTQGTTLVTSVAPVQGQWHRLDIICNTAGSVTLVLDGANTLTAAVPVFSFTASVGALSANGSSRLNWTTSGSVPQSVWNTGSNLTVGGFTSSLAPYNGAWLLTASLDDFVGFNAPLT